MIIKYICHKLSTKPKVSMTEKPKKATTDSLKKSLQEIRECLSESLPNITKKEMVGLKFSRIGNRYQIESAPIPPSDKIGVQLERSFNSFMKKLKVNYDGVKLEGSILLGTKQDMFMVGYNNFKRSGKNITKKGHSIEGVL
jgi:hypothetical protein